MDHELCWTSATDLAAAIRAKRLSPLDVTEAVLARIDAVNPRINAYCTVAAERARKEARAAEAAVMRGEALGPLHGVPVSFKDLTADGRHPHHLRLEDLRASRARGRRHRRRAGAAQPAPIVIGKTNTPEFGCKGVTDNLDLRPHQESLASRPHCRRAPAAAPPRPSRPDSDRSPRAATSPAPSASRPPSAAWWGSSRASGRVPRWPTLNAWTGLSHVGPLARTVRDTALALSVWAGPDERDPQSLPATGEDFARAAEGGIHGLRIGLEPRPRVRARRSRGPRITAAAAKVFATLGAAVEEAHPGFEDPLSLFVDLTAPLPRRRHGAPPAAMGRPDGPVPAPPPGATARR